MDRVSTRQFNTLHQLARTQRVTRPGSAAPALRPAQAPLMDMGPGKGAPEWVRWEWARWIAGAPRLPGQLNQAERQILGILKRAALELSEVGCK